MAELELEIAGWLGASIEEPLERETLASLRITAGPHAIPVTEVEDTSSCPCVNPTTSWQCGQ
jgi:hypothetical protein